MNVLYELDGRVVLSSVLYENRIILIICLFINWWIYNVINYSYMNFIWNEYVFILILLEILYEIYFIWFFIRIFFINFLYLV